MIFQKTIQQVLDQTKSQTRRLVQPGDIGVEFYSDEGKLLENGSYETVWRNGRLLYQVGKTYAAQAGRGQPAAGRIRLKAIRKERVNEISEGDARTEVGDWLATQSENAIQKFSHLWNTIHTGAAAWENGPECWALEFELVREDK